MVAAKHGARLLASVMVLACILGVGCQKCTAQSADENGAATIAALGPAKRTGRMHHGNSKVIFIPDFFSAIRPDGTKRLVSYLEENHQTGADVNDKNDLTDWYRRFADKLSYAFVPQAPGGILALVQLEPGKVSSVSFFCPQPISYTPNANGTSDGIDEAAIKKSVLGALAKVMSDPECVWPTDLKSVEVRLGFAGNPAGGSYQLSVEPSDLPAIKEGRQSPDYVCRKEPRTETRGPILDVRTNTALVMGGW